MRFAYLSESVLDGAEVGLADLHEADLRGCSLAGVDLTDSFGLTQEQLDGAKFDSRTKAPPGLTIE